MKATAVVSVIVPVYNVADYLDDCMCSIVAQTYENLEILLIDDGSTDGSGEICNCWAQRDARIVVFRQDNRGLSAARNVGLDHAAGEFVLFVDPDDAISNTYIETLYRAAICMDVPCVVCGFSSRYENGAENVVKSTETPQVVSAHECLARVFGPIRGDISAITCAVWCKIYRRSLFGDACIRFPEGEVYEDVSVMFPIMRASGHIGLIPDVLYFKNTRPDSITQTNSAGNLRDGERAHERFAQVVKCEYPDLGPKADRYIEKCRISHWLSWNKLRLEEGSAEAQAAVDRLRTSAMDHRHDLVLPADWRPFLTLYLLRFAPGFAPTVEKAWMTLRHPGPLQKNAIRYGLTTLLNYLLSFLIVFFAARALAAEALGSASFASSVVSYFALLAQMGIPLYGMRLCAKSRGDPAELSQSVFELFAMGALLTGASLVLFALTLLLVPQLNAIAPLMAIFGVGLLAQCINFEWAFKGLEEYRYLLVRSVAVKTLAFVLVLLLVHSEADLYRYAAITVFSAVGCSLVDFVRLRRFVSPRNVKGLNLRRHIRPILTFFLMSCATLIYANLDIVMLGFMRDAAEVGYYEIAVKAKVALTAIGGILWNVTLPRATALWAEGDRDGFERLAQRTLRFVCVFQAVVTIVFMICAGWVIPFIAGDGYMPAVPAFQILLLTLLPIGISNIIGGQVLIPAGAEKRLLAAELCGAGLNLVLNFALIPVWGIEGAAVATVAAEVVVALVAYYYAAKDLHVVLFPWDRALARALGALRAAVVSARYRVASRFIPDERVTCYCPCCETKLRAWDVAGFAEQPDLYDVRRYADAPQDVVCPVCGSIPRHRIIAWYLGEHSELVQGREILHFAPERSLALWFKRRGVSVTTADLFAPADLRLDLCDIDLPGGSYDVIVCNHVLEHVADWQLALAELRRVLRPGGLLICTFPIDAQYETVYEDARFAIAEERVEHFGQYDHLRVFGTDSEALLAAAGFSVEVVRGADCPDVIRPVVGPADYDSNDIFFCWKPEC